MNCPRDGTELQYQGFWKYPRHVCPQCKGVFATEKDLTESAGHRGGRSFGNAAGVKVDNLGESDLRCPADGGALRIARFHDAEVDVCPACHAIWLDSGELQKIADRAAESLDARRPAQKFKDEEESREALKEVAAREGREAGSLALASIRIVWFYFWKTIRRPGGPL